MEAGGRWSGGTVERGHCSGEAGRQGGRVAGPRHHHRAGTLPGLNGIAHALLSPQNSAPYKCSIIKVLHDTPASEQLDGYIAPTLLTNFTHCTTTRHPAPDTPIS